MSTPDRVLSKLPRAVAIYAIGDILTKAGHFLLIPILGSVMAPREYGILSGATSFAFVTNLLMQANLHASLMRFHPECRNEAGRHELVTTLSVLSLAWVALTSITLLGLGHSAIDRIFAEVRFEPHLRTAIVLGMLQALAALPLALLQAQQRAGLYRLFTVSSFLIGAVTSLHLVLNQRLGAHGVLMGQTAGALSLLLVLVVLLRPVLSGRFSPGVARAAIAVSGPMLLYSLLGWGLDHSNRVIIERYLDLDQLGHFGLAFQLAQIVALGVNAAGMAFTPIFYEMVALPDGPRSLAGFGHRYLTGAVLLGVAVAALLPTAVDLFLPESYLPVAGLVGPLCVSQVLVCLWHLIVNPLILKDHSGTLARSMLVAAIVSIGSGLVLVPRLGLAGAILAPLCGNLALYALAFRVSIRLYPVPYAYRPMAGILALGLLTGGVCTVLPSTPTPSWVALRLLLVVALPLVWWWAGFLPGRDKLVVPADG